MISIFLAVPPPQTTAQQQKRVRVVRNRRGRHVPVFYRGKAIDREAGTWATHLQRHRPRVPLTGPVGLSVRLQYPHLRHTAKRRQQDRIPKVSKPDCSNAVKDLEDTLVKLGFLADDQLVAHLTVQKWHVPADQVGIAIEIWPLPESSGPTFEIRPVEGSAVR